MNIKKFLYKKAPIGMKPNLSYLNYRLRRLFQLKKEFNFVKCVMTGRSERINYVPPVFAVCVSMKCNLRCPTCYYLLESPDNLNYGGFIQVDDFENMIDKYGSFIEVCGFSGGEALLHPEIGKLLEITEKYNLRTDIATNGILIKNKIDILRLHPVDTLSVSIDGYDYKTFKKYRGGTAKQFDSILEGLYLLRKYGINFVLSFMLTAENIGEIGKMIELASQVKPKTVGFHNINPHGDKRFTSLTVENKKCMQILENIVSFTDYPFDIELPIVFDVNSKNFKSVKCSQPFRYCVIDHNGNIAPCCQLMHSAEYGNIFKGYDFNSDKIRKFRRTILYGHILRECFHCQRRFMGDEYGVFDSESRKWILK